MILGWCYILRSAQLTEKSRLWLPERCKIWSLCYCAAGIYKVMQLSCHRVAPKISPQTNAPFMQPRNAQIVPFFRPSLMKASWLVKQFLWNRPLMLLHHFLQHGNMGCQRVETKCANKGKKCSRISGSLESCVEFTSLSLVIMSPSPWNLKFEERIP